MNVKEYKIGQAENINISPEELTELLKDSDPDVRMAACGNVNITDEALSLLSKDPIEQIRMMSALIAVGRSWEKSKAID